MASLTPSSASGVLAIARGVLAVDPDLPLDELAAKLAKSLGARRDDVRQTLLESDLFGTPDQPRQLGPRFQVFNYGTKQTKQLQPYAIYDTERLRMVMPFDHVRDAQMVCDGLNLELPIERAVDRARALDELVHGDGGVVRHDRPLRDGAGFVCDLLDRNRAWGPFASLEEADAWRESDDYLRVWAVTSHWPFSPYYPPATYRLFRPGRDMNRITVNATDKTPEILEAVRDYMAFQSETNRTAGPARDSFERLRALLMAAAAPPAAPREKLYVNDLERGRAWGPFASQVDAQTFLNSDPGLRRATCELGIAPLGTELLSPSAYHGRWPLWEGVS